jgi:hypothetical protein
MVFVLIPAHPAIPPDARRPGNGYQSVFASAWVEYLQAREGLYLPLMDQHTEPCG